ncbi:proton-conducting transporter transmembrane domain-containing protein [Kocuria sp.]|uniref:proton-conducting transporter transmembrane domain-containing protein n=1 Tax=Kocuria sp. TaxID=1871328 RepID=UPI0026DED7C8|nr:proton-conducting transporter membrane subunit [Kocuria sp.]MDO5619613.1 proton-conducting transporter membrane subunit [Kocuria sp.]
MGLLWILAAALPVLVAAVLAGMHRARTRRALKVVTGHLNFAPLALVPAAVLTLMGPTESAHAPWLMFGVTVGFDVVSRALTMVAILLYAAAVWAVTWRYDRRAPELVAYLLVCFVGNAGVYVAQDAVTFYASFSLMSLAATGLVLHDRTNKAFRAARIYLILAVISEMAVLSGVLVVAQAGGFLLVDAPSAVAQSPHRLVIVVLLLIGLGIKTGLVGLHMWLPLAHPAAPPAASAVLSGAMVKAGLVGMIRFLPLGEVSMEGVGTVVVVLALVGAFAAVLLGVVQRDPKVVLAYSTISQMGFLGVLTGTALAVPDLAAACITAAVIYAVHHGLAKGALFIGVPVWKHHAEGLRRYVVIAGIVVAGLVVVGAPLSSGAVGKYAAKEAIASTAVLGVELADLLPLVATGSTVLLVRMAWILLHTDLEPHHPKDDPGLPAWLFLVALSATVPWVLTNRWVPLDSVPGLEPVTLWDATWPVLIGLLLGAAVWRWLPQKSPRLATRLGEVVPPGDLVVPVENAARRLGRVASGGTDFIGLARDKATATMATGWLGAVRATVLATHTEERLSRWRVSGLLTVAVMVVLIVLSALAWGGTP